MASRVDGGLARSTTGLRKSLEPIVVGYTDCNHARNSLSHFERNVVSGLTSFKMCSNGVLVIVGHRRPFCSYWALRVGFLRQEST